MTLNINYKALMSASDAGRYSTDIKGLYFWIKDNGNKYWLMRYTFQRKRHDLSLGAFPEVSIAEARKKATELRQQINNGINPKKSRKPEVSEPEPEIPTFEAFALEVVNTKKIEWSNPKHAMQWENTLKDTAMPTRKRESCYSIYPMPIRFPLIYLVKLISLTQSDQRS